MPPQTTLVGASTVVFFPSTRHCLFLTNLLFFMLSGFMNGDEDLATSLSLASSLSLVFGYLAGHPASSLRSAMRSSI